MSRWCRVIAILLLAILAAASAAESAAKKKAAKQPAKPKAIYEAPMTVVIVRSSEAGCEPLCPEWISAEGEITSATPAAFRKVFKQMGKAKLPILIRSPGGSINHAIEIGRMIRKRKLDVAVGYTFFAKCSPDDKKCKLPKEAKGVYPGLAQSRLAFCFSACPMVLAAGTTRLASADTYVGVHQPRTTWTQDRVYYRERYRIINGRKKVIDRKVVSRKRGKTSFTYGMDKRLRKKLATYYKEMGVDAALLDDSDKAKFSSVNILTGERLSQLALRTAPYDANFLTTSKNCRSNPPGDACVRGTSKATARLAMLVGPGMVGQNVDPEMTVAIVRSHERFCRPLCPAWIAIAGRITPQTPSKLQRVIDTLGRTRLPIFVDSRGGDADAAIAIGRLIRDKGLDVGVARTVYSTCSPTEKSCEKKSPAGGFRGNPISVGYCDDACVLILLAGKYRLKGAAASISVRHPTALWPNVNTETISKKIADYFEYSQANNNLLSLVNSASSQKPTVFNQGSLSDTQLVNSDWIPDQVKKDNFCVWQPLPWHCLPPN